MPRGRVGAVVVLSVFGAAGSVLVGGIAGLPGWVTVERIPSRSGAPDFAVCGQIRWPKPASRSIGSTHVEPRATGSIRRAEWPSGRLGRCRRRSTDGDGWVVDEPPRARL